MEKMIRVKQYTCERCGHVWLPRTPNRPDVCPSLKCKSPYWDTKRKAKKK